VSSHFKEARKYTQVHCIYRTLISRSFSSSQEKRNRRDIDIDKYLSRSLRAIRGSVIVEKWSPDFVILNFITYREFNEARRFPLRSV